MATYKTCKKCGADFPTRIVVDGIQRTLNNRSRCLDCSPFQSTKTGQTYRKPNGYRCVICDNELVGRQTKFCSNECKMQEHQSYSNQQDKGVMRKIYLVLQSGGACQKCGYVENLAALVFHHLEPSKKKFELDLRNLSNRNWKSILKEYAKCDLLCANCHSAEHTPDIPNWKDLYNPNYDDKFTD